MKAFYQVFKFFYLLLQLIIVKCKRIYLEFKARRLTFLNRKLSLKCAGIEQALQNIQRVHVYYLVEPNAKLTGASDSERHG